MKLKSFLEHRICGISIAIAILLQLALAFQGFDICDDGFALTFFQQFYNHPESVEYNFLYWFSGLIGGTWYKLYENGGILWFRLLAIITNTLTFYLAYRLLKDIITRPLLIAALFMVLFVNDFGYLSFYHNQLTAFMVVAIVTTLHRAIISGRMAYYFFTGMLLSVNVFTRLPNAVLFILILSIPYAYYLKKIPLVKSIKAMSVLLFGALAGICLVGFTLWQLEQLSIMKEALLTLIDLGGTEGSSHNFMSVFKAPIDNYTSIALEGLKFAGILLFLFLIHSFLGTQNWVKYFIAGSSVLLFMFWFHTANIYPVYFLCLVASFLVAVKSSVEMEIKIIGFISLMVLITLTLGSAGGILSSGYMAIWIGLPLFFYVANSIKSKLSKSKRIQFDAVLLGLIVGFFVLKTYNISQEAYFDKGSRFLKTYDINNDNANGIYTTQRRAAIVNELLVNLEPYVDSGDYLLAYDKIPMLHFLTETKPYMYNPWVWIYDYNSFEKKLKKAEQSIPTLPIVVQQKFETIGTFSEPKNNYLSTTGENSDYHSNERNFIFISFLERHNYEIVWSNAYFNIYQPKE